MVQPQQHQPQTKLEPSLYVSDGELLRLILVELRKLNSVFECNRFLALPDILCAIKDNTTKAPIERKAKKSDNLSQPNGEL